MALDPNTQPQTMNPERVWIAGQDQVTSTPSVTKAASAGTELTRPSDANPYAIADAIANDTTGANVTPLSFTAGRAVGGTGKIIGANLVLDSATAFGAIRLHLFNQAPFAAAGYQAD